METDAFPTSNGDGWVLDVERHHEPARLDPGLRPVLLIPGYCMNTFPLGFHPEGPSMIEHLTGAGHEVWTANLRGQGGSRSTGGRRNVGFEALALTDLAAAVARVRAETRCRPTEVDAIGCSLGGTFLYTYVAHRPKDHGIGAMVGIGAPLLWDAVHPLLSVVFRSPRLAGLVPVRGTRRAARLALPLAKRVPRLLDLYMNTSQIDLAAADELVRTVEDPIPALNEEIARWVRDRELRVAGVSVAERLGHFSGPALCVVANADGIVPPAAARSLRRVLGEHRVDELHVGDDAVWFAHADLFVGREAGRRVFEPLARWLRDRGPSAAR